MKNYQKENCSGKALHFTRPLNLLFKEHPAAQTRWHFTSSPGQTWQFTKFTRQRHLPRAPTLLFPAATQSLRPPDVQICCKLCPKLSYINIHISNHDTNMNQIVFKTYVPNCVSFVCFQNFQISTWAQTSMRLLPAGTTSEIRCRKSASRRPVVSWAPLQLQSIGYC